MSSLASKKKGCDIIQAKHERNNCEESPEHKILQHKYNCGIKHNINARSTYKRI